MSPVAVAAASLAEAVLEPQDAFLLVGTEACPGAVVAAAPVPAEGVDAALELELEPLLPQPGRITASAAAPIAMGGVRRRVQFSSCMAPPSREPPECCLNALFRKRSGSHPPAEARKR